MTNDNKAGVNIYIHTINDLPAAFDGKAFSELWDLINAKRAPWKSNPWVWVIEFKRVDALEAKP